jgi:hypothetical protein
MPNTFHGTAIDNHDLKIVDDTHIEIDFLGNATLNKFMGVSTVKKDDDFTMLNVSNYLESFGRREASVGVQ